MPNHSRPAGPLPALFTPLRLGELALQHRVVLPAWTTRQAAPPGGVPTPAMAQHYAQRATPGGLLIGEAAAVWPPAHSDPCTPGLHSAEQVNLWRGVTDAVHARGGLVVAQLGQPAGATGAAELASLGLDDIDLLTELYRNAAENAGDAGFDGVELLAGHGALPELFLHARSNRRGDEHGGSLENRTRLLGDLLQALVGVWGSGRCGLCLSPAGVPDDGGRQALFRQILAAAAALGLAYVHLAAPWRVAAVRAGVEVAPRWWAPGWPRSHYAGGLIVSGGLDPPGAAAEVESGRADAVGLGRAFIANPDLPQRLREGRALREGGEP